MAEKVVLVTGGGRRIGAEIVRQFGRMGWRVVIHCRESRREAEALALEVGGRVICGDLTTNGAAGELIRDGRGCFGRLDCLVNNASSYRRCAFDSVTDETLEADFRSNFFAPFAMMREFAAVAEEGASVVNILDSRIDRVDPESAGYTLAKQSLWHATEMCALAWAKRGIRVNGVAPGLVMPADGVPLERMEHLLKSVPTGKRTTPEEIASATTFLATQSGITGQIIYVDGGWHLSSAQIGEKTPAE